MAGKKRRKAKISDTPQLKGGKTRKKPEKQRSVLVKAASVVILGSVLIASQPCRSNEYELSFISVKKKPCQSDGDRHYSESSRAVRADSSKENRNIFRPEFTEAYLDSVLVDLQTEDHVVAITDCGYCYCTKCICPADCVAACSCPSACPGACPSACHICNVCACYCDCVKGICYCDCDCGGI